MTARSSGVRRAPKKLRASTCTSSLRSCSGGKNTSYSLSRANRSSRKTALALHLAQISVSRAHHAHVHSLGRGCAQRQHLFGLQHAQQFGLCVEWHVADLVQNSVPPSAARIRPGLSRSAPENAPRLKPNSSLSKSRAGIAAQLTAPKRPGRPLKRCSSLATTSLPVPLAPRSTTLSGVGATRSSSATIRSICRPPTSKLGWVARRVAPRVIEPSRR